jgi:1-phosphofructokinase family hexose kinase
MIYTLTLNPAVDWELQIDHFELNSVSRSKQSRIDCGGKGFNVSRMLRNLKTDSIAMGFVGGKNGERLESGLREQGVTTDFIWIQGESRTNVSIVALDNAEHIKVNEVGPTVTAIEVAELTRQVENVLAPGDWWVMGGSLPLGVDTDIYAQLIDRIQQAGAHAILDSSGEALLQGCKARPTLVKPNLEEALQLVGITQGGADTMPDWVGKILDLGPKNLVVSLGKEGAMLVTNQEMEMIHTPDIIERNPIGAGDSLVAGVVWQLSQDCSYEDAIRYGVACGAATASKSGTKLGSYNDVMSLVKQCNREVIKVEIQ